MLHGRFSIQMDSMSGNLCKSYNTERHEVEYHPVALFNPDATWNVEVLDDYLSSNPDPVRRFPEKPDWAEGIHPYNCSKDMVAMLSRHSGPVNNLLFMYRFFILFFSIYSHCFEHKNAGPCTSLQPHFAHLPRFRVNCRQNRYLGCYQDI
jgi:hypothetical protein